MTHNLVWRQTESRWKVTPRATYVSEPATSPDTTLPFNFCKPIQNDPLGNFLDQKICDRVLSENIAQTTIEGGKLRDDWFSLQNLATDQVYSLLRWQKLYADSQNFHLRPPVLVFKLEETDSFFFFSKHHPSTSQGLYWVSELAFRVRPSFLVGGLAAQVPAPLPSLHHKGWPGFSHHKQQYQQLHPNSPTS